MHIRDANPADFEAIWPIFHSIVRAADTYAIDPAISRSDAYTLWMEKPLRTFVADADGVLLGTYYLKPNQAGPGDHVCNCGYMVADAARGRGVATAMCEHSQHIARTLGFRAMQFNLVVASNTVAVSLWQRLGFAIVGTIPRAFRHPQHGYVAAHVMYKWLADAE